MGLFIWNDSTRSKIPAVMPYENITRLSDAGNSLGLLGWSFPASIVQAPSALFRNDGAMEMAGPPPL